MTIFSKSNTLKCASAIYALAIASSVSAQEAAPPDGWAGDPPDLSSLIAFDQNQSNLRTALLRYVLDWEGLQRRYPVLYSPVRLERMRTYHEAWRAKLEAVDFDALNAEGKIDYILLRNRIRFNLSEVELNADRAKEMEALVSFAAPIRLLQETRFDRERGDPRGTATALDAIADEAEQFTASLKADAEKRGGLARRPGVTRVTALRAAAQIDHLLETLGDYNTFYDGYDPMYSFWVREPYQRAHTALTDYAGALREYLVGDKPGGKPTLVGDPVLSEGLEAHLAVEMIPYTAEELIGIGETEFRWIVDQMKIVSRRMGYGDDFKAALEHTKELAPPPGEAPWAIFEIADYEEEYIESLDKITLSPLAREIWRLKMATPEHQLRSPFFTGGEVTQLSYPTDTMAHKDKLMSMRGNTPHFNFPTVHHELVPGHHYQSFMYRRFNDHRAELTWSPFWSEGWALYWEFVLWDDPDFPRSDPDRMGMLFWRLHRAARIIFSLNYQLGKWTPQECVDFLVDEVGHERANAEAEVRRSTTAAPPLYQIAYMIGALQLRSLHRELVQSGEITEKEFHDGYLTSGPMPIEMLRLKLRKEDISQDYQSSWRFYQGRE